MSHLSPAAAAYLDTLSLYEGPRHLWQGYKVPTNGATQNFRKFQGHGITSNPELALSLNGWKEPAHVEPTRAAHKTPTFAFKYLRANGFTLSLSVSSDESSVWVHADGRVCKVQASNGFEIVTTLNARSHSGGMVRPL